MRDEDDINFDRIIAGQLDTKEKWIKEKSDIERKIALGTANKEDKVALAAAKKKITDVDEAIAEINRDRNQLKIAEEKDAISATLHEEQKIVGQLIIDHNIGFLIEENKYIYCMGMQQSNANLVNPIFKMVDTSRFSRSLGKMAKAKGLKLAKLSDREYMHELADYFQETDNDYYGTTASFHDQKWDSQKSYNKSAILRRFWLQPVDEPYDLRFDFLINCVSGGKSENMDHLEQWIAYKWMYPDRVGNTPNLDIGGFPGGNGKGRIIELCKTIFTSPCVIFATKKELMDGFNSTWELATILYYDEPEANELPESKLKQATGGEESRSEKKGIDATIIDRNFSLLFVSNNPNGVVKLAGTGRGGEDRRYSVMITDKVMTDEAIKLGLAKDEDDANVYVNEINKLIKQRTEVAKWLSAIIKRHSVANMIKLQALHGKDYHERFENQKNTTDNAFDLILPVYMANKSIPTKILHQLVVNITGYPKHTKTGVTQKFKRYLAKNKISGSSDKGRVKHIFKGNDIFEGGVSSIVRMDGATGASFDHTLITNTIPTKDTDYSEGIIKLGQDFEESDNVIAFKPTTASELVAERLAKMRQKDKDK